MSRQEFEVTLIKPPDIDGAYFLVPFNVQEVYGTKAHVKVRGTIDDHPYRGLIANMAIVWSCEKKYAKPSAKPSVTQ